MLYSFFPRRSKMALRCCFAFLTPVQDVWKLHPDVLSSLVSFFFFLNLFLCFQASSSHCLGPYLNTNVCLGAAFFTSFCFLMEITQNPSTAAFCWLVNCSEMLAQRQKDQQAEPDCSSKCGSDPLWKRKSARHVT